MSELIKFDTTSDEKIVIETKILDLVPENDPILKQVIPEFDFDNPPIDPTDLSSQLVETCKEHKGHGLSANQCGLNYRVFVMGAENEYIACFNPQIIAASSEMIHMVEGCLSFPMLALRITRPAGVVVDYQDWTGKHHQANFVGISARCFLHELDHMNGIVYTEKVKPLALQQGLKKRAKINGMLKKAQKKLDTLQHGNTN